MTQDPAYDAMSGREGPEPTLFTRIIRGDLPSRMVWEDALAVAFLDAFPQTYGHTLVVPRDPIDRWTDLPPDVSAHLFDLARRIGAAQRDLFGCERAGLVVQGYSVPHCHIHVFPTWSPDDFDPAQAIAAPDPSRMDAAATALRDALRIP